jgi:protein-L-isoaspartate(D-aspartate) O-methyltransferase
MRLLGWLVVAVVATVGCKGDKPADKPAPRDARVADPEPDPFAETRETMVRNTIERRGIHDEAVLAAMRDVPRHMFVPHEVRARAYDDSALPIGFGLTISQPYIVATMTSAAHIKRGDRVLEIGTGSGYQAAILYAMGCEVYTIEIEEELAKRTRAVFRHLGLRTIQFRTGDGYFGWADAAPFDAILVTTAAPVVPPPLLEQLKPGGRIVIPVGTREEQFLEVVTREHGEMHTEQLMQVIFGSMHGEIDKSR